MLRPVLAFLVAPLAAPVLVAAHAYMPGVTEGYWYRWWIEDSAVMAYAGAVLVGGPAYLLLRAKRWTAFWLAPTLGSIVAVAFSSVYVALNLLRLGGKEFSPSWQGLVEIVRHLSLWWPAIPLGAVVGALLWLIGRPADRQACDRVAIAFLVAPLAAPLLFAVCDYPGTFSDFFYVVELAKSPVIAYFCVFVAGLPLYMVLRARNWTAFWLAPVLGFALTAAVVSAYLAIILATDNPYRAGRRLADMAAFRSLPWPTGPIGAVVGALLWLIARPDRSDRSQR